MKSAKPRVLVLGSTGLTGRAIVAELDDASDQVEVVRVSRDPDTVAQWRSEGRSAAGLDLDDARTFPAALEGVDRLFVMTGYTVAMTHQTKTITDAAVDAGAGHIVQLGIFGNDRSTDPHFAGTSWSSAISRAAACRGRTFIRTCSWRTCCPYSRSATGACLAGGRQADRLDRRRGHRIGRGQGPGRGPRRSRRQGLLDVHRRTQRRPGGRGPERALGRTIPADVFTPDEMLQAVSAGLASTPSFMEEHYALSTFEWLRQTYDGRMDYSAVTTTTVEELLGRPPIHPAEWAVRHRDALLATETATTA